MQVIPLTAVQIVSSISSMVAVVIMLVLGKFPERLAAIILTALMFAAPFLALEGAVPLAAASGITLLVLVGLSLRYDRWWLIFAAGLQLVAFSTHFAPLLLPQSGIWAAVTLRLVLWEVLVVVCFFAVGECRWASYAKR